MGGNELYSVGAFFEVIPAVSPRNLSIGVEIKDPVTELVALQQSKDFEPSFSFRRTLTWFKKMAVRNADSYALIASLFWRKQDFVHCIFKDSIH